MHRTFLRGLVACTFVLPITTSAQIMASERALTAQTVEGMRLTVEF